MQRRIMNCIQARDWCEKGTWAYEFWDKTLKALIKKAERDNKEERTWH